MGVLIGVFFLLVASGCGFLNASVVDMSARSSLSECEEDQMLLGSCEVVAPRRIVTEKIGLDINAWNNPLGSNSVTAPIPEGFYQNKSVQFTDPNLGAANILSGVSIFGVTGSYICTGNTFPENMNSLMHRDSSTTSLSLHSESVMSAGLAYMNNDPGYRVVPKLTIDKEGAAVGSASLVDRTGWGATTCGTNGSIENRINDCATQFSGNATWDGSIKGNSGQGVWRLVARTANIDTGRGREVWRDERTKLLWSSKLSTNVRWCKASGVNFITGNPTAENDPDDVCDNATYQNVNPAITAISACFEDGVHFLPVDATINNAGKAGLGLVSTPAVHWRLPTKWDYHQAEINGIRFVLPDMVPTAGTWEWTSTLFNVSLYAWSFYGATGNIATSDRTSLSRSVRCIGR